MKKSTKILTTAVLAAALSVGSFAAGNLISISVDPTVKIKVNGEEFRPKDANGNDVMTFIYNGTTYAPLRALAEAYGLEVGYDATANMATVDEPGKQTAAVTPAADLSGYWAQSGWQEKDTFMCATIHDDIIEIYWMSDKGETAALYWYGSYTAPTTAGKHTWESKNNHEYTDFALMASQDDTKTFTYENGEITYSQSAMGMTTTVHLVFVQQ